MSKPVTKHRLGWPSLILAAAALASPAAMADAVCDWNTKAGEIVVSARMGPPPANRAMAIVQYRRLRSRERDHQALSRRRVEAGSGAGRVGRRRGRGREPHRARQAAPVSAGGDRRRLPGGAGERSPTARPRLRASPWASRPPRRSWQSRADDGAAAAETYRPHTAAGVYVPTVIPAATHWPQRKPWLMTSPSQFRPGPPPALTSALWARDYNEIKALGGKSSSRRTAEQTQIASFWEATLPPIYNGIVLSVADAARARGDAERAAVRGGGAGRGRCAARGVRRQVPLQLLAAGHRDPQRRPRRQRRDRARCLVDAVHRNADAPRVSVRALHRRRRPSARCCRRRSAAARCRH